MSAPELKPCPFCGGEAYTRTRQDEDLCTNNIVDWHFVGCSNCDVSFGIPDGYDCGTASEQWNTRADLCTPIHEERVARLVDAAKRLADLWDKDAMDRIGPATRQVRAALRDMGVE